MIGCLLGEVVLCVKIYDTGKQYRNTFHYEAKEELYGNTQLQEEFQNAWISFMEYIIVSNSQNKELTKKQQQSEEQNIAGQFRYQLTVKDTTGNEKILSNCADNSEDLQLFPIYSFYKGYLSGNTYIKDWINHYEDSYTKEDKTNTDYEDDMEEVNFNWLDINSLIDRLCQDNEEYSQYIAKNMVDHIQVYKNDIKNCLYYFYDIDSDYETISKSIMEKLYGTQEIENYSNKKKRKQIINEISMVYGEEEDGLTYDADTGLFYSEYTDNYYYESEEDGIQQYDYVNSETYERFLRKMQEQKAKTNINNEPLTKNEKEILIKTITKAIYIGNSGLEKNAQISVPIAAILGTPKEYNIYIGIDESLYQATQSVYMSQYTKLEKTADNMEKELMKYVYQFACVFIILGVVLLALLYVCGKKAGTEEIQYLAIDYWYTEIQGVFIILILLLGLTGISMSVDSMEGVINSKEDLIMSLMIVAISAIVLIEFLYSIVRKIKGGILIRQSVLGKILNVGQEQLYYGKTSKRIMILYLTVCAVWLFFEFIGINLSYYDRDNGLLIFMQLVLVLLLVGVAIILHRYLQQWEQIRDGVKRVKAGEINYQIPTDDSKKLLNLFARDINSLSEGLENAVDEMLKSEKLKTELISNVSHDIKTPLTSIITYVDLMKKEDVQPEKVKEYIAVLDQKSQRLKTLTDDLFEAAKATSGAMTMDAQQIDLGSLVNQAIGEFSEKLEKSDLDVRNNVEADTYYVMADGKLTWRIMENLLGNVSKYALSGSRVYIDAMDNGSRIALTLKNISNTELNISADELMERFTRGDQSRNTEGSGLGLNIAQSLAALQGGFFHVEIDGDLFKAILELPKANI